MLNNPDDEYDMIKQKKKKRKHESDYEVVNEEDEDVDECSMCLKKVPAQLILLSRSKIYVSIPSSQPLLPGQLFIKSIYHDTKYILEAQEDCLAEICEVKKVLCNMFAAEKKSVVFMETYYKKQSKERHMIIECLPIKEKKVNELRMFFKVILPKT